MTVASILVAAFCGFVIGLCVRQRPDEPHCPANVLGYPCKTETGKLCDHSRLAVLEAQVTMEKNRLKARSENNLWKGPES